MRMNSTIASLSTAVLFGASMPCLASQEDCQRVSAAYAKLVDVPYRQIVKTDDKLDGKFISLNNMLYANIGGSWDKMPYAEEARRANMSQLFDKLGIKDCQREPDGAYNGAATEVYSYTLPPMDGMSSGTTLQVVHISKDGGLPYLMKAGSMSVEISYENISAPIE